MKERRMFGLWSSPVTPASLAANLRLNEPAWDSDGTTLAWIEGRSDRGVLVAQAADGSAPRDLTPGNLSVRAFVGYGGGDFTLADGVAYFVGQADQRLYRQELAGGLPRPISPAFGAASTPVVSPDGRWVAYVHSDGTDDCLAIVDVQGEQWPARLATGADFVMQPAWSPSGKQLAWIEWDHPNMPWDGTRLRVADLTFPEGRPPVVASSSVVAGGDDIAIFQPSFAVDGTAILYVGDEGGRGQLYRQHLASGSVERLTDGEGEYGTPAWAHGMRRYAVTGSGHIVAIRSVEGIDRLTIIGPDGASRDTALDDRYTAFTAPAASPAGSEVAVVAASGPLPARVVVVDAAQPEAGASVRRRASGEIVPVTTLSRPEPVSWASFDGQTAYGMYWPPASARFEGEGAPPLVVLVHGGPTSQAVAAWDNTAQFLATRGYAALAVNYRGSTGYGRDYMLALRDSWGIYDVEDARSGAEAMVASGRADASRLVIMGGSAGGYTVLRSLVVHPGFYRAALCLYGVSNLFTLAADTHKFEARYLDSLIGPLPEAAARYRERSPIFHADAIRDPVALFQGDIDRVVPREQSDLIAASLRARGIPHEYHVFEGEGHGWRKAETIERFWTLVERFLREYVIYS
jgi:dipeptidyl aminopeptidase/acylaminoacyl peptidase